MQDLSILLETGATTPPEPEGGHKFETSQDFASFGQILKNAGDEPSINEEVEVSSQGSTNMTDLQKAIPIHNSMEEDPVGFESGEISFDQSEVFDISDEELDPELEAIEKKLREMMTSINTIFPQHTMAIEKPDVSASSSSSIESPENGRSIDVSPLEPHGFDLNAGLLAEAEKSTQITQISEETSPAIAAITLPHDIGEEDGTAAGEVTSLRPPLEKYVDEFQGNILTEFGGKEETNISESLTQINEKGIPTREADIPEAPTTKESLEILKVPTTKEDLEILKAPTTKESPGILKVQTTIEGSDTFGTRMKVQSAGEPTKGARQFTPERNDETRSSRDRGVLPPESGVLSSFEAASTMPQINPIEPARLAEAQAPSLVHRITHELRSMADAGNTSLRVQIVPEELGVIDLHLISDAEGMQVIIQTDQPNTGIVLQRHLNDLKQSLSNAGVTVTQFEINYQNEQRASSDTPGIPQQKRLRRSSKGEAEPVLTPNEVSGVRSTSTLFIDTWI